MLFASEGTWDLRLGKVYGVKFSNYSIVLIIDYSHTKYGRVLGENSPLVNIICVVRILRVVSHPPFECNLWGEIAPASIKYFSSTAVIVEPVGSVTECNRDSLIGFPAVC